MTPLLIGGTIYVLWRSETLAMFRWFELFHLDGAVHALRTRYGNQGGQLPLWLLYALPDATWVYSFAMYMGLLWVDTNSRVTICLMAIAPAAGIGGELAQALGLVPGTFDVMDLVLSSAACILSAAVVSASKRVN